MMRAEPKTTGLILSLFALALAAIPAAALESPEYLRVNWGVLGESFLDPALTTVGNYENRASPFSVNFNLGAGVSMPFVAGSNWAFAPTADLYYYNATYTTAGQPVAVDETFSIATVFGLLLDASVAYSYPIGEKISLAASAGLCIDARIAFVNSSGDSAGTNSMNSYFWNQGRFFSPSTAIRGEYKLTNSISFGFSGRVLWPIYNLWTNEGFGFFDQTKYMFDLVIRYRLGGKLTAPAPEAAEPPPPATP
jgi:hypothetical protein